MEKAEDRYFAEANRWDEDLAGSLKATARRAWLVAGGAAVLAALACAALALLLPLKRTEPFLVRVDATTGAAEVVPAYDGTEELPEAVLRHLISEYVTLRERYIPALAEADYEQVGAYQSATMNQAWATAWTKTNPQSPLNLYAEDSRVTAQVRSISFLRSDRAGPSIVQVRIRRSTQMVLGGDERIDYFVATLTARFAKPSDDTHLRALNPLGFCVLEYRREPEDAVNPGQSPATTRVPGPGGMS